MYTSIALDLKICNRIVSNIETRSAESEYYLANVLNLALQ